MPWDNPDVHTDMTWGQQDLSLDPLRVAAGDRWLLDLIIRQYKIPTRQQPLCSVRLGLRTTTIWAGLVKVWIQHLEALRWNMKTSDLQTNGFSPQLSSNGSRWQLSFWLFLIIPASIIHNLYLWKSLLWFFKFICWCRNYFSPNCNIMSSCIQGGGLLLFFFPGIDLSFPIISY